MTLTLADRERLSAIEAPLREKVFPPQLVIENTSYCNLRCVHCYHRELLRRKRRTGQTYPVIICQFSVMPADADEVEAFRTYRQARGAEVKARGMLEWTASEGDSRAPCSAKRSEASPTRGMPLA